MWINVPSIRLFNYIWLNDYSPAKKKNDYSSSLQICIACAQEKTAAPDTITKKHGHIRLLNTEKKFHAYCIHPGPGAMHTWLGYRTCVHGLVPVRVRGRRAGWTCLEARSTIGSKTSQICSRDTWQSSEPRMHGTVNTVCMQFFPSTPVAVSEKRNVLILFNQYFNTNPKKVFA
jgi:hypothetical protein